MMKKKDPYLTKDLYEAALIYAKRKKFLGLQKADKGFFFCFEEKAECEKMANDYWAGEVTVNAKSYADSIRTLKDRLFNQRSPI